MRTFVDACLGRLLTVGISSVISVAIARGAADSDAVLEMARAKQWTQNHLIDAQAQFPFSFVYDRQPSARLLPVLAKKDCRHAPRCRTNAACHFWIDEKTGLQVKCVAVEFTDYPVLEWTVYLKDTRTENTRPGEYQGD